MSRWVIKLWYRDGTDPWRAHVGHTPTPSPSWRERENRKGGLGRIVEAVCISGKPGRTRSRGALCAVCRESAPWRVKGKVSKQQPDEAVYLLGRSLPTIDLFYGGRTRCQWWERERRGVRENEGLNRFPEGGWHVYSWYELIEGKGGWAGNQFQSWPGLLMAPHDSELDLQSLP